jgi:hypothetical protein
MRGLRRRALFVACALPMGNSKVEKPPPQDARHNARHRAGRYVSASLHAHVPQRLFRGGGFPRQRHRCDTSSPMLILLASPEGPSRRERPRWHCRRFHLRFSSSSRRPMRRRGVLPENEEFPPVNSEIVPTAGKPPPSR